jgi:IS30 family transposase
MLNYFLNKKVGLSKESVAMKLYHQLNEKERMEIYKLYKKGFKMRKIAAELGRSSSTIWRELKRNKCPETGDYLPDKAHLNAKKRKHVLIKKVKKYPKLKEYITEKLRIKWSPDAIAGRIKREGLFPNISTETIYQYIYSEEGNKEKIYMLLPFKQSARNKRGSRKPHKQGQIAERVSIHERPEAANSRSEAGHFEGDPTFFKKNKSANLLVITERVSRYTILVKNLSKHASETAKNMFNALAHLPKEVRKSITFDNGKEFAKHTLLRDHLGMKTYFCDPHSPWQKGQVEKTNAMLHRYISKNSSILPVSEKDLNDIQIRFNNIPRRILQFKTSAEAFSEILQNVALRT